MDEYSTFNGENKINEEFYSKNSTEKKEPNPPESSKPKEYKDATPINTFSLIIPSLINEEKLL